MSLEAEFNSIIAAREAECAEWRAHAEALAGALDIFVRWADANDWGSVPKALEGHLRTALARLPADALAARRALEACATELRGLRVHLTRSAKDALAALYAARGEDGAHG